MPKKLQGNSGFSLFEILLVLMLLSIAVVPMMSALRPSVAATGTQERQAVLINRASATLNRAAALDFDLLAANIGCPVDLTVLFGSAAEAVKENFDLDGQTTAPQLCITDSSGGDGGRLTLASSVDDIVIRTVRAAY